METSADRPERNRDWRLANHAYLLAQVERVRLLLHRRILWLRHYWSTDPLQPSSGLVVSDAQADRLLAGPDPGGEANFHREDPTARRLSDDLATLDAALAGHRQALADAGTPAALDTLGYLFDLTAFEQDVLLLCLAPELDPAIERLYAYVQDDARRGFPTPHLACELFDAATPGGRASLMPGAPLRRFRLITLEPGPAPAATPGGRPLRLDERVGAYLQGADLGEERLDDLLQPVPAAPLTADQRDLVEQVLCWTRSEAAQAGRLVVRLVGPAAVAAAVAWALTNRLGARLYRLDPARLPPAGPERQAVLSLLERETVLAQFAVYLDTGGDDDDAGLAELLERLDLPVLLVGSPEQRPTGRAAITIRVPKPGPDGQRELWRMALAGTDGQVGRDAIDAIVQQFDLGPREIVEAVAVAAGRARPGEDGGHGIDADGLWQACRERGGLRLDDLARRIRPRYGWDDIVLPTDSLAQLKEIAAQVAVRPRVYEAWGFGRRLGPSRGISALFAGPSGTGKTMAAEILAGSLRLDLYRVDLAGVVSKYIGETEKNLRQVFDAAERSGAILCFDEADALFGTRSEVKDSHDRYANIEVDYLLQRMEDYRGLAILTTNRKAALDRAFLRRLRFLVEFPFPDADLRRRIWQRSFPPEAPVGDLDWGALARLEIPGGNIRNIALNAAFLAARDDGDIALEHVLHAARREYAKTDKLLDPVELGAESGLVPA
jgi:ATPase family associated with various cellular activities (AAA)